jgi:hypothetical protein
MGSSPVIILAATFSYFFVETPALPAHAAHAARFNSNRVCVRFALKGGGMSKRQCAAAHCTSAYAYGHRQSPRIKIRPVRFGAATQTE